MALKDWKRILNQSKAIIYKRKDNKNLNENLEIWEQDYFNSDKKEWIVARDSVNLEEKFNRKSDAMKFAIDYMRNN